MNSSNQEFKNNIPAKEPFGAFSKQEKCNMFVFMPSEKLNPNSFVFYFLPSHQFPFVSFGRMNKSSNAVNSILMQTLFSNKRNSLSLCPPITWPIYYFLPLSPDNTSTLDLNFLHLVHVLSKLRDVCVWFASHSPILVIPLSRTSNFHLFIHQITSRGMTFWMWLEGQVKNT